MFRSVKILLLVAAIVVLAGAVATSALTSVSIDRTAAVTLKADNDTNAAIKITCINNTTGVNYSDLCQYDSNGVVSLDLNRILTAGGTVTDGSIGFNRNASFQIGATGVGSRVLAVTNNSDGAVTVYFSSAEIQMRAETTGTTLTAASAGTPVGESVAAGGTKQFFFGINTPNSSATSLSGTIQIR